MADEVVHKQTFVIRDLATRSVTLYPSRAEIVRDIRDVILQPGSNEITIQGLTPTADENSIKVEGKGQATITDMTVELMANTEKYEDIYPNSDSEESSDVEDDEDGHYLEDTPEAQILAKELANIGDELERAQDDQESVRWQLKMLGDFATSVKMISPDDLGSYITAYRKERSRVFDRESAINKEVSELSRKRLRCQRQYDKAMQEPRRQQIEAEKEKDKRVNQRHRASQAKRAAKARLKAERAHFWPKKIYRVTLTIDTFPNMTPASSRRGSIASSKPGAESPEPREISLSLAYITDLAFWVPRYDLNLNSTNNSGLILYRAEFCNTTSETWKDAKITLSTSQTSFQGLGDPIPSLSPWLVRLNKVQPNDNSTSTSGALQSQSELHSKSKPQPATKPQTTQSRAALFGFEAKPTTRGNATRLSEKSAVARTCSTRNYESDEDMGLGDLPATPTPSIPPLLEPETSLSESGLTTTYGIPIPRTLSPSFTTRRHRIASISLAAITFSHLLIPKLRPAAFLTARIHNSFSKTLLAGPASLTLDGAFLGNTRLPRCGAGDAFDLSLGVDPSVGVSYAAPVVKRSETGFLSKGNYGVYTRTCTITNMKAKRAVEGKVLDQVPVSEDEKLRVEVLQPAGLGHGEVQGKAKAMLRKDGEVCWDVKVEAGKAVTLVLEYEARYPSGEKVVAAGKHGSRHEGEESDESEDMGFGGDFV